MCGALPPEDCHNGVDDDHDGWMDCADPDCQAIGECCPEGTTWNGNECIEQIEKCGNNYDDDGDGFIDCADSDCFEEACGGSTLIRSICIKDDGSYAKECLDQNGGYTFCDYEEDIDNSYLQTHTCTDQEGNNILCNYEGREPACCGREYTWNGNECEKIPEDCSNGKDDDYDLKIDCVDEDCYLEPNVNEKGCDITNDSIMNTTGEIGYYCADDGEQGMCCPEGTVLDTNASGDYYCKATQELCFNNIDDDGDDMIDCADDDCNTFTGNPAQACTGSTNESRDYLNYSYPRRGPPVLENNYPFYCSYGWTEEETTGHCCPQQSYWKDGACRQDQQCEILWNTTFPENSTKYQNNFVYTSPYDQACCPVIRFGEAEYKGWKDVKIY